MEEPTPMESTPPESKPPGSNPPEPPASPNSKVLAGALLAVVLVVGLYYVNRYWIAPAVKTQAMGGDAAGHPMAPAFSLTDITGKPLNLSDFHGNVVMLDFWATWCGPCRIEIPDFIEFQKRYGAQGFTMIGISMDDSPEPVVDFYKELQMNYPVAVGNDRLGELYGGMPGLPTTFLIGRDGRIYAKHVGSTPSQVFEEEIKQLLAAGPEAEAKSFQQAGRIYDEDKVELGNPAAIDSEVPGVDLTKLTADQKEAFKKKMDGMKCTCGCNRTMLNCRQHDRGCSTSLKVAKEQLDALLKEKDAGETSK